MENTSIDFLYGTTWDDRNLSELKNSDIINIILKLEKEASKNKQILEIFLLDFENHPLLEPRLNLLNVAELSPKAWLETLPLYNELMEELEKRNIRRYYEIVKLRKELENNGK